MNSYLLFEDMKCEAMSGFKQTWPRPHEWSTTSQWNWFANKIRICVTFEQYEKIQKMKGKVISFTFKKNDSEYFIGHFDLKSTLGVSEYKWGRIIDLHLSKFDCKKAPKDFCRDLLLGELLD